MHMRNPSEDVHAFVARFGLDQSSLQTILDMAPEVQRDVLSSFHPQDATRDVNKLFQSFCRSRSTGRLPGAAAAAAGLVMHEKQAHHIDFFNTYGLNETSQNALLALPVELQAEVLVNFRPKDSTRDANSLFLAFIKSRSQSRFPQLAAALNQTQGPKTKNTFFQPTHPATLPTAQSLHAMHPAHSQQFLSSMMGYGIDPMAAYAMSQPIMVPLTVEQFAMAWNLNEISINLIHSLPGAMQADVMQNFRPRDPSRDVNGVFLSFAKSRMQLYGMAMPPVPVAQCGIVEFARRFGLSREAVAELDDLSAPMQQKIMMDFQPKPNTRDSSRLFAQFLKSRIGSTFAEIFDLNNESLEIFNSLEPVVQADVVKNFAPKAETRDMNGLFQHFVRSRASGGGIQRGTKRNLDTV